MLIDGDKTLTKGLLILELLSRSQTPLGVTQISEELELTKSNVHRLINTLVSLEYLTQTKDRLYRCTMKTWRMGNDIIGNIDLARVAGGHLRTLAAKSGETVHLAVLDGLQLLTIEEIESENELRIHTQRGIAHPLHCVAGGKVMLAFDYENFKPAIQNKLTKYTDKTITSISELDAEMKKVRKLGYAVNLGEYHASVGGIAAPILDPNGRAIATVGLAAPLTRLGSGDIKRYAPLVLKASAEISSAFAEIV